MGPSLRQIDIAVVLQKGLAYIASRQQPDGSFGELHEDIVLHAAILQALSTQHSTASADIRVKLAQWLGQHYQQGSVHAVFCALSAMAVHDPAAITGTMLGQVARLLVAAESQVGGPYLSQPGRAAGSTMDPATNALIAQFVSSVAQPLPNLVTYIRLAADGQVPPSPAYTTPLATAYHLAKALRLHEQPPSKAAVSWLEQAAQLQTPLHAALAVAALRALQLPVPGAHVTYLLEVQAADGSWESAPYYQPHTLSAPLGSSLITTALAIEALTLEPQYACTPAERLPATSLSSFRTPEGDHLYEQVFARAHEILGARDPALYAQAVGMLDRIRHADDNQEIVLLPYFFARSLRESKPLPSEEFFVHLGLANLFNWMSFTIYDDFYDGEGEPPLLPAANAALHHSLRHFLLALPVHHAFQQSVHDTFDKLDSANSWEIAHCRFTIDNGQATIGQLPHFVSLRLLADRSYTHILPLLAVLAYYGFDLQATAARAIAAAGRHYLISRQLNDDMHDWEEDLRAGNLTYTLATTCQELHIAPGDYAFDDLFQRVRRQFWRHTIARSCDDLEAHIRQGQAAAIHSGLLLPGNILQALFASLHGTLINTRAEHTKSMQFLQSFTKP